jgi:hypothetical protein
MTIPREMIMAPNDPATTGERSVPTAIPITRPPTAPVATKNAIFLFILILPNLFLTSHSEQ